MLRSLGLLNCAGTTKGGKRPFARVGAGLGFTSNCMFLIPTSLRTSPNHGDRLRDQMPASAEPTLANRTCEPSTCSMRCPAKLKRCLQVLLHLRDSQVHPACGHPSSPGLDQHPTESSALAAAQPPDLLCTALCGFMGMCSGGCWPPQPGVSE